MASASDSIRQHKNFVIAFIFLLSPALNRVLPDHAALHDQREVLPCIGFLSSDRCDGPTAAAATLERLSC
jgi:hypothetical protein